MARYTVNVVAGDRRASLLVVFSPSQLCSALLDTVKSRLPPLSSRLGLTDAKNARVTLHLNTEDGPMLDLEDLWSDCLPDPKEVVYAVIDTDINAITLLPAHVPLSTTLRQLKGVVQEHLGFPSDDGDCPELECNCSFARQIDNNATFNNGAEVYDPLRTVIIVHSNNDVVAVPVGDLTLNAIQQAVKEHVQRQLLLKDRIVNTVGGVEDTSIDRSDNKRYLKAPVLAICSKQCQTQRHDKASTDSQDTTTQRDLILDIHTSECPLEITAHNANITLEAAGLADCAINGVLNIFAVQRWTLGQAEAVTQGKAGIFKLAEAWKHHVGQSDRGISNLLSTLRVFTHLAAGSNMEDERQDAVLRMIHLLTQFPPAVRASYILMRGETPQLSEKAALAQCLYEVLKKMVPLQVLRSDPRRFFEGSRLLFGLILEKAKNLKLSKLGDNAELPYVGMRVYDLRNMTTMSPVLSLPVQTKTGLVDLGFYQAFDEGGLLRWTNDTSVAKVSALDPVWNRVATVSGGTKMQVVTFGADVVQSSTRYADAGDVGKIISPAEYTDMTYLANLCSRNELTVVAPAELASADAPVLTLDREGFLAVYVGREACGAPGRDILMFRPTSDGEDEGVDVSIITGLLEPILAERTADGTIVFEAYGSHHRKMVAPEEITMICVDLSASMTERCEFTDVQRNEDGYAQIGANTQRGANNTVVPATENPAFYLPDPDELKEYLKTHESYDDFLAIISTGREDYHRRQNAEKVLLVLHQLHEQQIEGKNKELEVIKRYTTQYYYRTRVEGIDRDLNILRNRDLRLQKYRGLLCAWLITCIGRRSANSPAPMMWRPGDTMPTIYKASQQAGTDRPTFEVPRDLCCHISNEIMEDPVITVDNYTYERRNIERWLQTNERSPLTNLILASNDLRPNVQIKQGIVAYLSCSDIISRDQTEVAPSPIRITFRSPLQTHSLDLPRTLKLNDLWEIAFRLTKGRYPEYELQHQNARVPASQEITVGDMINANLEIFITPVEVSATTTSNANRSTEEPCLVKVYGSSYDETVVSYWEPRTTTKSLASAVFRYYRQKFTIRPSTSVEKLFTFWTKLYHTGDNHRSGTTVDAHWGPISQYFNRGYCTGTLATESCVDNEDPDERDAPINASQPLVFKLRLGSPPRCQKTQNNSLSRLDVLKQMFDAYINRLLAYNFQTHIGLVTFSTKASVSQKITHAVENFRHKLNNMAASGDTAIWDSIALALDQLQQYAKRYPNANLRIICISDGEDNKSQTTAVNIASQLLRCNIVVDSFCLGNALNKELKTISYLSGGYTFEPKTLEEAMAICEMEPVLSVLERPDETPDDDSDDDNSNEDTDVDFDYRRQFRMSPNLYTFREASWEVDVERVTPDSCPERKQHPELEYSFVELGRFAKQVSQNRTDSNLRQSRIHTEIRNSGANPHPHYDIYLCESNMGLWKVVMQGPPESTYSGGTFLLYIKMGENYPMSPPEARIITPIYHPNINRHGRICHSILDRNWTVDTTTKNVIDTIYSLLLVPEFSDPINTVVTLNFHWDEVQFKEEAQRHIAKHASKGRAAWRKDIVD